VSLSDRLTRIAGGVLGAFAFVVCVLIAAPYFVSEQQARGAVLHALRDVTGVEPQIDGPVSFALLPNPAVQIDGVRLDDGVRPAFTAATMQATVRLLPLLYGRVEIASLTFGYATLSIDVALDGGVVVGMPLRQRPTADNERPEIRFNDGTVLFRAEGANHIDVLSAVDAALAWSGAGVTATGSFYWRGVPATFGLSVADTVAFNRGNRSAFKLRLESDLLRVGFDGGIAYRNGIQADGALAADAKSLRRVITHVSYLPLTRDGFGPFKLKAQAALTSNSLALSGLSLDLDGSRADGGLTIKRGDGRTSIQATLASETSDLTPYSGGLNLTEAGGRDWSREPLRLSGLDAFDLDVRMSVGRVVIRKTELQKVAATASMRDGRLTLTVGDAQFRGGTLRGRAALGRDAAGVADVKLEGSIANFDLATGLDALASVQNLEGKGTLSLSLEGQGEHVDAVSRALSGTVTLNGNQGALSGINVEQVLNRFERRPLATASGDVAGGRTAFDRLSAKLRIVGGTAQIEEAQLESARMRVKIAGEASVVRRELDLRGTATLLRSVAANSAAPFELPFLVQGPWEKPNLRPDPAGLIQRSDAGPTMRGAALWQALSPKPW
jgi:AsmA protein